MSNSMGVVYEPYKSELDEEKVILFNEDCINVEKRQKHWFFKTRQKSIFFLCSGVVTFLILTAVIYFVIANDLSKQCHLNEFICGGINKSMSCSPLQSVKEIGMVLTQDSHHSCIETFTCHLLIHEILKHYRNNNLSYNFLVSSDFRLILMFGYGCSIDSSLNNTVGLRISYIENSQISERKSGNISHEDARSTMELIYHGIKCNRNQSNFIMNSLCLDGFNLSSCGSVFEKEIIWFNDLVLSEKVFTSHSSISKTAPTLLENLKLSVCEDPKKDVVLSHPKKLSESLERNSCLHYEPVDHISVEVVEVPCLLVSMENFSCERFSNITEAEHAGLKYNFILGHYGTIHVGTGFHCRTNNTRPKSLRIKVLRGSPTNVVDNFQEMRRISEIINHGLTCGKILNNYSISDNPYSINLSSCFPKYENISHDMVTILSTSFGPYGNEMGYDSHDGKGHTFLSYNKLWISSTSCHHKEHLSSSLQTETIDTNNKTLLPDEYSNKTTTVQPTLDEPEEMHATETMHDIMDYDYYEDEYHLDGSFIMQDRRL